MEEQRDEGVEENCVCWNRVSQRVQQRAENVSKQHHNSDRLRVFNDIAQVLDVCGDEDDVSKPGECEWVEEDLLRLHRVPVEEPKDYQEKSDAGDLEECVKLDEGIDEWLQAIIVPLG